MRISSGPFDIHESGTVIAFNGEKIRFLVIESTPPGIVEVAFLSNEDGKQRLEATLPEPSHLLLTLWNFDNPLGTGNIEPLEIGHINDRKLYLSYRVYSLGKAAKTLHYTFYLGEKVAK